MYQNNQSTVAEINPGTLISNRYLIQELLGRGGFGRTYLAFDTQRFGEHCVLKEFVPTHSPEEIINKSRELFEREAKILHQINHPQIPKFQAWLTEKNRLFIVQDYIDGKTYSQILSDRLSQKGKTFSEGEIRAWLADLLPVLDYIHDRKIIHRDISLDNVMLPNNQSKPMLIDFGVVKEKFTQIFSGTQYPPRGSVVGKIGYSPPEQLRLGHCYPSSDLYALAVCAIVMLTGKMPYMLIDDSLQWQWRSYAKVSNALASIINKMLADVPTLRYQSAKELINILQPQTYLNSSPNYNFNQLPVTKEQEAITKEQEETLVFQELEEKLKQADAPYAQNHAAIAPEFLRFCQQELASFVGPFASFLIKHTLEQKPDLAPKQLIEELTQAIPHREKAEEFQKRILVSLKPAQAQSYKSEPKPNNNSTTCDPQFIEECRRQLTSFVGPFGTIILQDALSKYPQITRTQLVDMLVAEIPDRQRAQEFAKRIAKSS